MTKREAAIIVFFGMLAVIQASFVPHLGLPALWFSWLNVVDAAVAIIAFFEKRKNRASWFAALSGGVILDIYSTRFFGFWIIILLGLVGLIKFVLKKYVRIPSFW